MTGSHDHDAGVAERARSLQGDRLLAAASALFARSLDYEATMKSVVRLAVPDFAAFIAVDLLEGADGPLRRLDVAHAAPEKAALLRRMRLYGPRLGSQSPIVKAVRTGRPALVRATSAAWLKALAVSAEHLDVLRRLAPTSAMHVPLVARGQALGALTFLRIDAGRPFDERDLATAVELATRAALAISYAQLERDAERALRERDASLALLDGFLASAPVGFALLDRDLRYVRINATLAALNGLPAQEHIGKTVSEMIPHVQDVVAPMLRRVRDTGEAIRGIEQSAESWAVPGRIEHWLASYFPVRASSGEIRALGVVVIDISEQKRAEEELRRDAVLRERFLGILSHDLRNPLWSIDLTAATLLRLGNLGEAETRGLRRIVASSGRIERMVNDLLDLTRSRLGAGNIPIRPAPADLQAICLQAVEELESVNPARAVRFRSEGDSRGVWDADRLAQLVSNLVDNALSYSPPDTPVSIDLREERCAVVLEVNNQGPPIPGEIMPRLFDAFHRGTRTDEAQQTSRGLGLGLFIAQQIVHAHGGSIRVASDADHGTTFTVELPRTHALPCAI